MNFKERKQKAKDLYKSQKQICNPYLGCNITFNSDGFHHLQFSARRERKKEEQMLKFNLLPLAIKTIKKAGTLQEYRKQLITIGKKGKDGFSKTKEVEYWGFSAIFLKTQIKIRVILKRTGDGKITFWSVMPDSKLKGGQKLYIKNIEDEE